MLREIIRLRSDAETKAALEAVARARGTTMSDLLREQIRTIAQSATAARRAA